MRIENRTPKAEAIYRGVGGGPPGAPPGLRAETRGCGGQTGLETLVVHTVNDGENANAIPKGSNLPPE